MNEPLQVAPGVWVLPDPEDKSNTGVVVLGGSALVVRSVPVGEHASVETALGDFFQSLGRDIEGLNLVLTSSSSAESGTASAEKPLRSTNLPLPGWALLTAPASGRQVAWNPTDRVLFSGDLLTGIDVPVLARGGD